MINIYINKNKNMINSLVDNNLKNVIVYLQKQVIYIFLKKSILRKLYNIYLIHMYIYIYVLDYKTHIIK